MDALTFCKLYCSIESDFPLVFKLTLVTNQIHPHVLSSVLFYFLQPTPQIVESFVTGNVISEENTVRPAIENSCHRLK